jgi:ADP-dependent NAD(P)H-hydrate dehydratase / NAD(P)H-hydrate epimerase
VRPVLTAEEMRRVDARATAELGIPGPVLMENAGRGAAEAILAALPERALRARGLSVAIICGRGGNGGDGFVVARRLKRAGARPDVLMVAPPEALRGDAAVKFAEMRRVGIAARVVDDAGAAGVRLRRSQLVVDALLGTGARGAPAPLVAALIEAINASGRPVVALDLPSGLSADGEVPAGPVVRAWLTATFAAPKLGLVIGAGPELAGRVVVVPIGVPAAEVAREARTFLLEGADVAPCFPRRRRDAHKGGYGHLLVVAGSVGKTGAAALCARAALRAGVGLVTVGTAASAQPTVAALSLEAMTEPLPETTVRSLGMKAREPIVSLAEARDAIALGPGLGLDDETRALARVLVAMLPRPMVVDADALTALADHLESLRGARGARVLTPHPGEMARLLGGAVADVQRDRLGVARAFAVAHGVHLVLKGADSLIAGPDGRVLINPTGNAGMATGGTGDVLTGILGALLARGIDAAQAAPAAVYLHGLAGDVAAERVGQEALIASDVIESLGDAFRRLADER